MNQNLDRDPRLTAGLGLFAACATLGQLAASRPLWADFLMGALTGASLLLVLTGILRTSPRGQILLGWVRRFKSGLVSRRAV